MAEITAHRRGELFRAVFEVLIQHPDGLPAKNVLKQVEENVEPTDFENADYPNRPGVRRFEKHVRFATIKAVKAGWLVKTKGEWSLTDEGRAAYRKYPDPLCPARGGRDSPLDYRPDRGYSPTDA